ncbi:hypothetical protein [Pseudonocardia alni]|uniref:hypothetical protein n=1 Tax=Pseudonocardia alni TaxID=33907 RepID=UPI00332B371E
MPLRRSYRLTVHQDHGQFDLVYAWTDLTNLVDLIDLANTGDGIAQDDSILVVFSPHQNNFDLAMAVEEWDGAPPDDLHEWQEGFEAPLPITDHGVELMSPSDFCVPLDIAPGTYRIRIVGRGFVNHGWPGSTTPGDDWRLQLWPSDDVSPARRLLRWEQPTV